MTIDKLQYWCGFRAINGWKGAPVLEFAFGCGGRTRQANTVVDQLFADALQTTDDERRNELLGCRGGETRC